MKLFAVIIGVSTLAAVPASCSDKRPLTFQVTVMAQIVDTNAQKAGFHTYRFGSTGFKASNGATLTLMYGDFKTNEEAKRFLEWTVQQCFKTLSEEMKKDRDGNPIEYRVELVPEREQSLFEVMWVVGNTTRWIFAKSREDALELEKYYKAPLARHP